MCMLLLISESFDLGALDSEAAALYIFFSHVLLCTSFPANFFFSKCSLLYKSTARLLSQSSLSYLIIKTGKKSKRQARVAFWLGLVLFISKRSKICCISELEYWPTSSQGKENAYYYELTVKSRTSDHQLNKITVAVSDWISLLLLAYKYSIHNNATSRWTARLHQQIG